MKWLAGFSFVFIALTAFADPVLTVNGVNANYTTTKFFIDEIAHETNYVVVIFQPNAANLTAVEVFSNLDRRDFADVDYNGDGIPDGIKPPDGNTITTADTGAYYRAYSMVDIGGGTFSNRFAVTKCGAYRLTARYKVSGNPNWIWYSDVNAGRRDHAIVVSPRKALEMTLYEVNTLNANASNNDQNGRGMFADFTNPNMPINLNYFDFLQVNCLWFQPIHPVGYERAENDPATGQPYQPGSPYSIRDYFAVSPAMGTYNNESNAMDEFTNFVAACDAGTAHLPTINVMLDGVFNHTSWDAEMGQGGVDLGITGNVTNRIGRVRPDWYSSLTDYCQPATYYNSAYDNDFAEAPDRGDFGKWPDVADLYFGRYAALVCHNPDDNNNYLNEGDWYDYSSMTPDVVQLWRYFAYYPEYWLKKTGHPGTNSWNLALDNKGIDGLRCDFGQGLPPQAWEYIINHTRHIKWNFVFMAETLDGGVPGYRSNRQFDILNENLLFLFTQAHINNSWDLRNALESRRAAYSGGEILLNLTSHDEVLPDNDAWITASRYGALGAVDGLPMIFYGQEKGDQNYNPNSCCWYYDGFKTDHELNFGKYIPHFKKWNQLVSFSNPPPFAAGMDQWYGRVNWARLNSPALSSQNRYFLSRLAGGDNAQIFAVAKYEVPGGSPANTDVVLAFANLLPHGLPHSPASDVYNLKGPWSLLGLDFNREYNVRNLASSNAGAFLWGSPRTGLDLWNNGIYVSLKADSSGAITDDGSLVQYLKIVDVGAAPTGAWDNLDIPGAWNSFPASPTPPFVLGKVTPPGTPAAKDWYTNTIYCATSGGDVTNGTYEFKLRANDNWSYNWGGAPVTIDGTTALTWNSSGNANITLSNGFYYSFRVLDPPTNQTATIAVLKTSASPVGVAFAGISPPAPRTNETATISINLTAAKSPEEHIYVRWTTNSWASSAFVEATGSGVSYAAVMPMMPNGAFVQFYVMSSTAVPSHSTADALTLNLDTNGGLNYSYVSAAMPWPGGSYAAGYPNDPATAIVHNREEAVVGNGYLTAMLDANGSLYDIYFPSVGLRSQSDTANEGYRGPDAWPQYCTTLDAEANGQMNVINGCGGLAIGTNIYWLVNANGTDYADVGQRWVSDDANIVYTTNRLVAAGNSILIEQYDFAPAANALPVVTDGTRTNRGAYVKRFLLTNQQVSSQTIDFYWDVNFNVKGDNANDVMVWTNNEMIVYDNAGRVASGTWCAPDGYGATTAQQYDPTGTGAWSKSNSVYFATVMKLVTNGVSGAGTPADGSWRDLTATDNQEGWIAKRVTIPAGQTVEVDVMIVGSWDDFDGATGTHTFWGEPLVNWFYTNNLAAVQAATQTYWSNWLAGGVTINFPDPAYNRLFKRSLLVSALCADAAGGGIIAGMHNGAYPFVWPRDGVYAAMTFDRTGHTNEADAFYGWLRNAARATDTGIGDKGFFYQKYTTDGQPVWTTPQVDETAGVPWGLYYHYLTTGDAGFLNANWNLAYTSARASSENSTIDTRLFYDAPTHRMSANNVWEDQFGEWLYSNASVVRGLRDAAAIATAVGSNSWASTFNSRADDIATNGILPRIDAKTETADISQLGLAYPFEVLAPNDPRMTNVIAWIQGQQAAGGFTDDLVETNANVAGLVDRYQHKTSNNPGDPDSYWNGGPWFLASSWYGMYFARWQDDVGGKDLISTNKTMLDNLISKLGPMGLAGEQIAINVGEQQYTNFWLQTAWPNTWESHTTLIDQMWLFLDYKPLTNGCYFAPKLPAGWSSLGFSNLLYQSQRFDIGVSEGLDQVRADLHKRTTGSLNVDVYLRLPAGTDAATVAAFTNGTYLAGAAYDLVTGRVHIQGPLKTATGNNALVVNFNDHDSVGDGIPDWWRRAYFGGDGTTTNDQSCATCDPDGDGQNNLAELLAGTSPTDPTSVLRILSILPAGGGFEIKWSSVPGIMYQVRSTTNLLSGFTAIPGATVTATGTTSVYTNTPATPPAQFYDVQVLP